MTVCEDRGRVLLVEPGPFSRILVGYLPTEQGADARALGVDLAAACGAELLLVSVVAAVWIEHFGEQTGPAVVHSGERERAASALEEAAAELAGMTSVTRVERRLEASSSPARGLHDTAMSEHADLIVVGSSHHGPVGRVLLGSAAERLLNGAPCAVALAPRGYAGLESHPVKRILVAFDGSPEARLALRVADGLAARTGAAVRALVVVEPPASTPGAFVPFPGLDPAMPLGGVEPFDAIRRAEALERRESAARATLQAAVDALGGDAAIEREIVVEPDPTSAILEAARGGADLLVLGSRGYGPVRRALVGSVSVAVIRRAPCSVVITPRAGEHTG